MVYYLVRLLRAISSVGQSWRLITAWSRVQVLDGPPIKNAPAYGRGTFYSKGHPGLEQPVRRQSSGLSDRARVSRGWPTNKNAPAYGRGTFYSKGHPGLEQRIAHHNKESPGFWLGEFFCASVRGIAAQATAAFCGVVGAAYTPPASSRATAHFPRAACRPPLHPTRKPAPLRNATAGPRHPPYGYPDICVRLQGGVLTPPQESADFLAISYSFFSKSSCILVAKCYNYKRRFVIFSP